MSGRYFSLVCTAMADIPADAFDIGVMGVSEVFSRRGDIEIVC